jgi:hypothetical protein
MRRITAITAILAFGLIGVVGCGGSSNTGGTIQFTASGEVLALGGYKFPPGTSADPVFVDGWEVVFDEVLVTLDNITLSENPDKVPGDQSQTDQAVARVTGPWAVDLHKGGPLPGKGGSGEQAVAIAMVQNQNLNGNKPFDDTKRYAFGFDIVAATNAATKINLDATGLADYQRMVDAGWAVYYSGTATFKGTNCTSTNPSYPFIQLPTTVKFKFGFKSPTTYINCQNPDNGSAGHFQREDFVRGVQTKINQTTIAQATVHTDHPFWESFVHGSPAHFDQLAAQATNVGGTFTVTLDDVAGVDFTSFTDKSLRPLPWRSCVPPAFYTFPDTSPAMNFDSQGIPYNPSGDPTQALRGYRDYMTYTAATEGHLNADGLCAVKRNYPAPQQP